MQKWGSSLGIRIPKAFAHEAHLEEDTPVEMALVDGKVVLVPVPDPAPTLEELLAGVTDENRHGEFDTGPAVGNEVW